MAELIKVSLITPSGDGESFECDSLVLNSAEGKDGTGGGSFGIRFGHTDAVCALAKGEIKALLKGEVIRRFNTDGGLATVTHDSVGIVLKSYKRI